MLSPQDNTGALQLNIQLIEIKEKLSSKEPSLQTTADDVFKKAILLSSSSYFEHKVSSSILEFIKEETKPLSSISSFAELKGLKRQYHTLFSWDTKNANSFFKLFGDSFHQFMKNEIKENTRLEEGIQSFLSLGHHRNLLVHNNFHLFELPLTSQEICDKSEQASYFVENIPNLLRKHRDLENEEHPLLEST